MATTEEKQTHRFGQGLRVDRAKPHFFHRDFWALHYLVRGAEDFLKQHGQELQGGQVLDFGAGVSPYAALFENAGIKLIAADINPDDPAILAITDEGRVPLPDAILPAILSTQVLEHVADVQAYLREAHRLLKPNGILYLSTHGAFILHRHPTDFRRWTTDGLIYELEQAGFTVEKMQPRIGILAMATHLRSIAIGGLTRRIPLTGWLRPIIYLLFNLRMGIEEKLTPTSVMEAHPELLLVTARKR